MKTNELFDGLDEKVDFLNNPDFEDNIENIDGFEDYYGKKSRPFTKQERKKIKQEYKEKMKEEEKNYYNFMETDIATIDNILKNEYKYQDDLIERYNTCPIEQCSNLRHILNGTAEIIWGFEKRKKYLMKRKIYIRKRKIHSILND